MNRPPRSYTLACWLFFSLALVPVRCGFGQTEEPALPAGIEGESPTRESEPALPEGLPGSVAQETEEPALPGGLQGEEEPELPSGLQKKEEPPMPRGMEGTPRPPDTVIGGAQSKKRTGIPRLLSKLGLTGFWEVRGGIRTQKDRHEKDASIGETRLELEMEPTLKHATLKFTTDFLYDPVLDRHGVSLETGRGWLDLRETNVSFSPLSFMDLKFGRQILTWGTGDLIFINDLFPKDFQSFFIGRDEEYLKAPSDALKTGLFTRAVNLDVVYTPKFDSDRFIRGERISFFNAALGKLTGRNAVIKADIPDDWFDDSEWAARLWKNVGGYELAAYGYKGFWKSPGGMNPATGKATFPDLDSYGGSVRGPFGRGIGNVEVAYYDSREDRSGKDPLINNSQLRFLVGYEMDLPEIAHDFTVGLQYYLEWMADHDGYRRSLPPGIPLRDEYRHVLTLRLTKLLMNQNLTLSLFSFYSPSDSDAYLRPNAHYKIDDHWSAEAGGNVFVGSSDNTFFGQFKKNTNVYAGLRYGF